MDIDTSDRPSIIIPPPLSFCVFLGAGFLLDYLFPIKLFQLAWWPRIICGGLIIAVSGYLALGSISALLRNKIWMCLAVPALLIALDITAVRPEEEYLACKFGGSYLEYKAKVRRWL